MANHNKLKKSESELGSGQDQVTRTCLLSAEASASLTLRYKIKSQQSIGYYQQNLCAQTALQNMLCFANVQCASSWFWNNWNTAFWPQKPETGTETRRHNKLEDCSAVIALLKMFFLLPKV